MLNDACCAGMDLIDLEPQKVHAPLVPYNAPHKARPANLCTATVFIILIINLLFYSQSLLETHDSVASKNYETPPPSPCSFMDPALNNQPVPPDAVRMVGIRKVSGEHLVSLLG